MKKSEARTGVRQRQLGLFDENGMAISSTAPRTKFHKSIDVLSSKSQRGVETVATSFSPPSMIGKPCKHPQKSIRREMLSDTCMACGVVRSVKPDGMLRIEGEWAAPVDKRLTSEDLSEDQRPVVDEMVAWAHGRARPGTRLLTMSGLAGTGKTTCLGVFAALMRDQNKLVAYATFTGRASSVLGRKLRAAGVHVTSHQAKPDDYKGRDPHRIFLEPWELNLPFCGTLHKLLYRPVINDKEEVTGWKKRDALDRKYDLLIIDESSMISDDMLLDLQHHKVPILAVGDHGQLPPVMASGNLMRHPMLKLLKIHRQARDNPIIRFARHVRKTGELDESFCDKKHIFFESKKDLVDVLTDAYRGVESPIDVAVLCWTNRQRIRLNLAARRVLEFSGAPSRSELLICLKNMKGSNADIYNGMRGVVAADTFVNPGEWEVDCDVGFPEESIAPRKLRLCGPQFNRERVFESVEELNARGIDADSLSDAGAFFDFGYAMTVHKAQGGQAKHVVFYVEEGAKSDEKFWRKFAYTGISRSSDKLTILT